MQILFIEDDASSVEPAIRRLEEADYVCKIIDFSNLQEELASFEPDVVVLDMMDGGATIDPTGKAGSLSYSTIWDTRFCPIVVYSANPDLFEDVEPPHPFIRKVKKGRDSEDNLYKQIQIFLPCINGIRAVKIDVDKVLHHTLRDLAPLVFAQDDIGIPKETAIQHMGRRRVAAYLDESSQLRTKLAPWEQYIYPPLDESLKLGDIIYRSSDDRRDPSSFRIVLTPSCDLVKSYGRDPKVIKVLCAKCEKSDVLFSDKVQISKKKGRLASQVLSQGFIKEFVPIPGFPGLVPPMIANLKKLELIDYSSIADDNSTEYARIVSVDSPFREQIAWAYQNTACRPGVPDRDFEVWEAQYLNLICSDGGK